MAIPTGEFFDCFIPAAERALMDGCEMQREAAQSVALVMADTIRAEFGGTLVYITKEDQHPRETHVRDEAIRAAFDGSNIRQLARKFGLSEMWVRKILSRGEPRIGGSSRPSESFEQEPRGVLCLAELGRGKGTAP